MFSKEFGCVFQTELLDVVAQFGVITAFGEHGTDALLRQIEAIHDSLTFELGIEEQLFAHDDLVDMLEQLLIGECIEVEVFGNWFRFMGLSLFQIEILVVHGFANLLDKDAVLAADGSVFPDDHDGKSDG